MITPFIAPAIVPANQTSLANPGSRSSESRSFLPILELMRACYGGTETMRQMGETFLPKENAETELRYKHRLNATTSFNKLQEAVESASAKPFKNLITLNGADREFESWVEDIDLGGHHLHIVAHQFFNEAVLLSRGHILVDHPTTSKLPNLAVQRAMKVRPFMRLIRPEDLLACYEERIGGVNVVVHARIACQRVAFDRTTFRETLYDQVFVIEQGVVQLWERPHLGIGQSEATAYLVQGGSVQTPEPIDTEYLRGEIGGPWRLISEDRVDLDEVPLVTMRTGDRPIFQDLAYAQIRHWRSTSLQDSILAVSRFPMLAASGIQDVEDATGPEGKTGFEIGPNKLLLAPDPNGRWYYVETNGAALEAGQKNLEAIEVHMEQLSLNPIINQPGRQYIAQNERSITEARVNTVIHDLAITAKDNLERAIDFMAKWSGRKEKSITLNMNFDFSGTDQLAKSITEIRTMMKDQTITAEGGLRELQRLNLLADEFDIEAEVARQEKRSALDFDQQKALKDVSSKPNATRPDNQA